MKREREREREKPLLLLYSLRNHILLLLIGYEVQYARNKQDIAQLQNGEKWCSLRVKIGYTPTRGRRTRTRPDPKDIYQTRPVPAGNLKLRHL